MCELIQVWFRANRKFQAILKVSCARLWLSMGSDSRRLTFESRKTMGFGFSKTIRRVSLYTLIGRRGHLLPRLWVRPYHIDLVRIMSPTETLWLQIDQLKYDRHRRWVCR